MRVLIAVAAVLLAAALVGVASAAPTEKNSNIEPATVICDDLIIGTATVLTMGNGVPAFLPNGRVVVALRDSGTSSFTVKTFDGLVSVGPFDFPFEAGARGKGFESRLIECPFTATFTDTLILTPKAAAFFGIPAEYAGTEVTAEGTAEGTAWVIIPGS